MPSSAPRDGDMSCLPWESAYAKCELWEGAAAALVHRGWSAGKATRLTSIQAPAPGPPQPSCSSKKMAFRMSGSSGVHPTSTTVSSRLGPGPSNSSSTQGLAQAQGSARLEGMWGPQPSPPAEIIRSGKSLSDVCCERGEGPAGAGGDGMGLTHCEVYPGSASSL